NLFSVEDCNKLEEQFKVLRFIAYIADEAFKDEFIERYEELEWVIETLKEQLNIPIFERKEDEEMFLKAFYAKKEYLD
ncbi:MAG TPA: hypothetical protein DEG69_04975, partial [Flavobacteriaceae bacterium]|nr:hypothetical protein [Flavobacteriaceae bacterium]